MEPQTTAEETSAQTLDLDTLSDQEITEITQQVFRDTDPNAEKGEEELEPLAQQTEAEPEAETVSEPEDQPELPEDDPPPKTKGNFRLHGPDAKFARLIKESIPHNEAYRLAYGQEAPATTAAKTEIPETAPSEVSSQPESIESQLRDLLKQKHIAEANYRENYDPEEIERIVAIDLQREDLLLELTKQSAIKEFQKAQQHTSLAIAQQAALAEATSLCPALADEGSIEYRLAQSYEADYIKAKDPRVGSPSLTLEIAQQVMKSLNREPAGPANPPRNAAPTPSGRQPTAKPAAMPTRANPPAAPITEKELDQMSPEEVEVLFRQMKGRR